MKKFQTVFAITLLLMLIAAMTRPTSAALLRQSGPTTWTVLVGAEAEGGQWQLTKFYPHTLTINEGDSVVFKQNAADPHNVIFFSSPNTNYSNIGPEAAYYPGGSNQKLVANPKDYYPFGGNSFDGSADLGSGILGKGSGTDGRAVMQFQVSFPKAGSYNFGCAFHADTDPKTGLIAGMVGNITVQAAGSAYPKTQAQIDIDAQAEIAADSSTAMSHDAEVKKVDSVKLPDGSTTYKLTIGGMVMFDKGGAEYLGYSAPNLTIKQGDMVEWSTDGGPQTVTFAPNGSLPPFFNKEPVAGQPDKLVININGLKPSASHVYDGAGYFTTGAIAGNLGSHGPNFPHSAAVLFNTPGSYQYASVVDGDYGMKGSITVTAGDTAPLMPQTGSGGLDLSTWALIAAAFVLIVGLMLLALRLQRGRKQAS